MSTGAHGNRPTRSQQRDAARAQARELRLTQAKQEKRRKILLQGGIAFAIVAIATIITLVITLSNVNTPPAASPANIVNGGVLLTAPDMTVQESVAPTGSATPTPTKTSANDNVVQIQIYQDYLCPACKLFDQTNASQIQELVNAGVATLDVHPIAMLSPRAGDYSTLAANAAACVATYSPASFWSMNQLFYGDFQPDESSNGRSSQEIADTVASLAPNNADQLNNCILNTEFSSWVSSTTTAALDGPMLTAAQTLGNQRQSTPTVLVNGQPYGGPIGPQEYKDTSGKTVVITLEQAQATFLSFINQVAGTSASTATPTPAP